MWENTWIVGWILIPLAGAALGVWANSRIFLKPGTTETKSQELANNTDFNAKHKSQGIFSKLALNTRKKVTEVTEEAIAKSVDQAINVIELAGQRIRESNIPTENVALEVSVSIAGVVEIKMQADVPREGQVKQVIVGVNNANETN